MNPFVPGNKGPDLFFQLFLYYLYSWYLGRFHGQNRIRIDLLPDYPLPVV